MCSPASSHIAASWPKRFEEAIDHALLRFVGEGRSAGQTKPSTKQVFRDGAAYHTTASVHGLQVHRLPDGARFDVVCFEVLANLLGPDSEPVFVKQYASQSTR